MLEYSELKFDDIRPVHDMDLIKIKSLMLAMELFSQLGNPTQMEKTL